MQIVAELGSCFRNEQDLIDAIHLAKSAGADAIKYQYFSHRDLYGFGSDKTNFDGQMIPRLAFECRMQGIEFMCTFFNPDYIERYDSYINIYKVASSDMCYLPLLEAIRKTRKPVYLSTGGHSISEIKQSIYHLGGCPVTVLYCSSSYPANDIDFGALEYLSIELGQNVGLSDHSTQIYSVPRLANMYACPVLEKHFNPFDLICADSPHSLNFDQFRDMVTSIRQGDKRIYHFPKPSEKDMLLLHNRRAVATMDIEAKDKLIYGHNYGYYRTKDHDYKGLHCFNAHLEGLTAGLSIKTGEGIGHIVQEDGSITAY